jgi:predicted TIM-barrel fold metal-dependent hydrolase
VIIDSHCHAGQGDGLTGPWDTDAPLGAYLRRCHVAGIDRTVLFPAFTTDYAAANRKIGRIVLSAPDRFYGYAMVNPQRDRGRASQVIGTAVREWGACGIKVHRHDGRITREILDAARRFRLPVLYDVMGETAAIELIAQQYPDLAVIVPHLGSFADDWRAQLAVIDQLARHRNVYADTSGVRRFGQLVDAVRRAGPEKLLFGTDGPWLHPGVELAKVMALGLPQDAQRLVLGGNWLRLTATARRRWAAGRSAGRLRPAPVVEHRGEPIPERGDPWAGLTPDPVDHRA